jgi:RHS repeat-associated protein
MAQQALRQKKTRRGSVSHSILVACALLTTPSLVCAEILQSLHYGYDDAGNVTRIGDQITLPNTQTLTYDDLDRMLAANGPYGTGGDVITRTYTYNEIGNILTNSWLTAGTYTYPASGAGVVRPHAVQVAGPYQYSYDNNGNQTGITSTLGDYSSSTTFNVDNRLASAVTTFGTTTINSTFVYDGEGSRVKKIVGTTTTRYISRLYECETTGGSTTCSQFIWAGDQRIATISTGGTIQYWNGDHLGSTNMITNSTGAKVQALTYQPHGGVNTNQSFTTPAIDVPYKYTGKEFDYSTDFYYYESRYYDPWFGRFISADTIVPDLYDPQDLNRYAYARNNPMQYTDPSGHFPILIAIGIGIAVGAISAGIQSDWDLEATLIGGVLGGASAGVGTGVASSAYYATLSTLGGTWASVAGGVAGGAVAGGTSAVLANAAGYRVNIGLAIASGAAAGGIAGGGYGLGNQLGALAAAPLAGASAAAISGADPGIGAAIAAATAAFSLGVNYAYQASQGSASVQGPPKQTSYATRVGNVQSRVHRNSIHISDNGILTFDVKVTGLPVGSNLSTRLQTGLVVNLTDNVNVNFRPWTEIPSLPPGVDANGIAHFGVSVSGVTGPAYMRIIPQGLVGPPPVITNFGQGPGAYIPCHPCNSNLPYTQAY